MLTPPNEALAARDAALPGLTLLLDPKALAEALGTDRLALRHLRYKIGTSCAAAALTGNGSWVRLRALTAERYAEKNETGRDLLDSACIELGTVTDDRDLPGLHRLWPERTRAKAMARLFGEGRLATAQLEPLSYRLGRRLVARLDHPDGAALMKVHSPGRFAQAQAGAVAAAMLGHAPLERICGRSFCVVTRWLPGKGLCAADGAHGFAEAGASLAALHDGPAVLPFSRSRHDEIAAVARVLADVAALVPNLEDRAATVAERLAAALAGVAADPGAIHGDFSADQVVIDKTGARLIDWDRAGTGDRAADLGSALARLDADRIACRLSVVAARSAAEALRAGYGGRRRLSPALEVQRLAHLAALSSEPFRRQVTDWPGEIARLLAEVERGLDRVGADIWDAALPQLATLLSPAGAQAVLDDSGAGQLSAAPRLVRHKPGRRAMIELQLEGERSRQGWFLKTRSKRPDHATPSLHHALRTAGFDGHPGSAFAVPEMRAGPEGLRVCLMERVPGQPLAEFQVPGGDPAPFESAGRALAALHECNVTPDRKWQAEDEAEVAVRALDAAAARHPEAGDRIAVLRTRAAGLPDSGLTYKPALLHRDFYPDQVLVDDGHMWLVDLDLAARGDAHVDLGNMLAHLDEYAIRQHGASEALEPQKVAFLRGYAAAGGTWCNAALMELHAVSLMRHLDICNRIPGRSAAFRPLLEHIESCP